MTAASLKFLTDTWIATDWHSYHKIITDPIYQKAKCYYSNGQGRIEMSPVGNHHAQDHSLINFIIHLYATVKGIDLNGKDNCSYRKAPIQEVQPDLSFYIGQNADAVPFQTTVVDLNQYPPPNLVVEISYTSLIDDRGEKRWLYEDIGVQEYWIVDVSRSEIMALAIANQGSRRIQTSLVLPQLKFTTIEEALEKSRQTNHSQVGAWLNNQFKE